MPSWKKVVASGSDASFSSATVDTFVSASSFRGSFTGSLFGTASQALTASYLLGYASSFPFTGSAQITGSLGVTGSFSVTAPGGSSVFSSNADTLLITGSLIITGSGASITGSLNVSNGITGSLFGTASQAVSASYAFTASSAISASFAVNYLGSGSISTRLTNLETASGSFSTRVTNTEVTSSNLVAASGSFSTRVTQIERTYATTGSNIFTGSQNILGAITASAALINGTLTAQTLVVTTVSSSVVFSSGSNVFGNSTANTQTFTGSVNISGSLTLNGRATLNDLTGSLFGTASWATNFITGSVTSASYAFTASSAISSSFASTASSVNTLVQPVLISGSFTVVTGSGIEFQVTNTGTKLGNLITDSHNITGSLAVFGSITGSLSGSVTGSLFGTASQALTASYSLNAANAFIQGGNSFGTTATLGTNDAQALSIETNNISRIQVLNDGNIRVQPTASMRPLMDGMYIETHPESDNPAIISYLGNDIAYNTLRGGTFTGTPGSGSTAVTSTSLIEAMFDGAPTYAFWNSSDLSGSYTASIVFPQVYNYGNTIGFSFGQGSWRAQNFKVEILVTGSYYTLDTVTNWQYGSYNKAFNYADQAVQGARITFSNFASSGFRIADIYLLNYNSIYGKGIYVGRDGGQIYKGITVTGSVVVTSGGFTGSLFGTASQATSASYAFTASSAISSSFAVNYLGSGSISTRLTNLETASGSFSTRVTNTETTASNLVAASASFSTRITNDSSSLSARVTNTEATASSLVAASASFSTRTTNTEITSSNLVVASGSFSTRVTQIERTYATTGSNIFTGSQNILGAITASAALINGTLTAQTLVVTTVSSSVVFSSGSNIFGNSTANTQTFTGSVNISGSLTLVGRGTINDLTGSLFGTSSWASGSISASYAYTASSAIVASASLIAISSSYAFTASSAINASASLIAVSSSYAFTASSAISASNALTASYVPASAVFGLNLSQIATGSVTASVGLTSASFQIVSGSTNLLYVSNSGNIGINNAAPSLLSGGTGLSVSGSSYTQLQLRGQAAGVEFVPPTGDTWEIQATNNVTNPNSFFIYNRTDLAYRFLIDGSGNVAIGGIRPSASLDVSGSFRYTNGLSGTGSVNISGSTLITGSLFVTQGITGSLFGTASQATSASYAFTASSATNAFSSSFALTASFVNPLRQNVIISGSLTVSASSTALSIQGSGSNVFTVDGTSGRLFEIDDSLSGSLFSVNTAAGLPVIEAFSDNTVRIGQFGQRALFVSQSRVGVGTETPTTNLDVSGSGRFTNGLSLTGSVNSLNGYTGSLFGTASWARNAITASYALGGDASAILYQTASAAFTWSFNHFLQTQYPVFTIYDNTNSVIVPQRIQAVDTSSALIYFSSPTTGIAVASKGGYSSSVVTSAVIANTAITASFALSGTGTFSGSFSGSYQGNFSGSLVGTASQAVSASYAATSSFANNFTVANTLTAQTIVVSTISSSVVYSSGSNIFGNSLSNTQTFTGSINATGSTHTIYGNVGIGATGSTAYNLDLSGSMRLTNNLVIQSRGAIKSGIISHDGTNLSINYGIANQSLLVGSLASSWNTMIFAAGNAATSSYAFYAGGTGSLFITNLGNVYISGSLGVSGGITGSLFGTSSQATSASYAFTASSAISSSFALTASYALNAGGSFPYTGSAQITGSLGVTGSFSVSAGAGSSVFSSNADTLLITGSLIITGSGASITGSLNVSNGITGSLFGTASQAQTASFVLNAVSSSYSFTASSAISASYAFTASSASTAFSASYAQTSSFANNFTVANTLTAQTIVVSTISSSVVYSSGSNIFGNSLSNTQTFTGSVGITGSLNLRGNQLISGSLIFTTASTYTPSYDLEIPQSAKNNGIAQIYGAGTVWTISGVSSIVRSGTGNSNMLSMFMGGTSSTTKQIPLRITGSWDQSGTAGYTILEVAAIENTIGTGPKLLQDWVVNGVSKASIDNVGTLRLSGSANITGSLSISGSLLLNQSTSSLGISTQTVSTNATSSYTSVFYNYTLASGSNARAGQVVAVWSGSAIQYMDNSTTDIGNTSLVALTASLSAGNVLLTTVLPTAGWTVKTLVNLL